MPLSHDSSKPDPTGQSLSESEQRLIEAAHEVRARAYAPYSDYHVGAALLSADEHVYIGTNIENVSFGATICAERAAIGTMISAGDREIRTIAIATEDGGSPCGICLQTIAEFGAPDVLLVDSGRNVRRFRLDELAPHAFQSGRVHTAE